MMSIVHPQFGRQPNIRQKRVTKRRGSGAIAVLTVVALTAAGCSNPNRGAAESLVAAVASYDVVADRPTRFIVGLYSPDQSQTLAFGTVTFTFNYLGDGEQPDPADPPAISPVEAVFLPIPGQELDPDAAGPTLVAGSVATGVYATPDVEFDRPGFWEVAVAADVDDRTEITTGAFEVLDSSDIPAVGDPAPRTRQPLAGDPTVDPKSIDSRAGGDTPIPDPELHDITVADAIAAGRPVMVVVSTPTFCVSRFCGPITDSVNQLTLEYGDRIEFIHLEVWRDFAGNELNPAAVEWIAPTPETDGGEPWVFVIDADGIIVERFDNVASDAELLTAVESVLNSGDR
jgi:hypothetical protein